MADAARARKVADRIHETVARLLQGRIKDPRLGFVTVTDVRVTGDLQQATVFYTVYGSDEEREETAKALRSRRLEKLAASREKENSNEEEEG